ncbi:hypothetical protein EX895_001936 [Sporisorium graminicola]|uniref:FAM86 N-terminal domain-containing protein n=1 Tax=Sporisorium graminicola TaxID=280036 RepID=A0A4U7KX90_9BASI|nr:hypothetical protein EX895_001936 [Sporisorium graminicola]TKY89405.1 hypothetical protein EX895_001936 [Sporisorium graminicola]
MSNKPAFIPSRDLRNLRTLDLTSSECLAGVRDNLDSLAHLLGASGGQIVHAKPQIKSDRIEVYAPSEPAVEHPPKEIDSFETSYVTRWLSRLISEFTLTCPDDESTALQAERLSERCAALLALAAGRMAAGASVQDHIFQLDDDDNTNLVVKVRDAALVHDSLGTHTWGAAPILSQLLLPLQAIADDAFNVLELGAGTGLVGLTLASWSRRYRTTHETQIVCTDYHPTVLENLAHNIMLNGWNPDAQPAQGAKLSVTARCLDWQSVHRMQQGYGQDVTRELTSQTLPNLSSTSSDSSWSKLLDVDVHSNTFDMLVAADCVYDPVHPFWIRSVAEKLLKRPDAPEKVQPLLHVMVPLRPTHLQEIRAVYQAFEAQQAPDRAQLTILSEHDYQGYENFGAWNAVVQSEDVVHGQPEGGLARTYRWFRIGWQSLSQKRRQDHQ